MVVRRISENLRTDPKFSRKQDLVFRDSRSLYVILIKQLDVENQQKLKLKKKERSLEDILTLFLGRKQFMRKTTEGIVAQEKMVDIIFLFMKARAFSVVKCS